MSEVESVLGIIDQLIGTPLYLLMCLGTIVFFVYYFWKVAPARYKAFEELIRDNAAQSTEIAKLTTQYEKTLENSNKVIENNTAALKSTQSMLELVNSKVEEAIALGKDLTTKAEDNKDKLNDLHIAIVKMHGKLD